MIEETGLSRFPVYNDDIDDIIGVLNARDYLLNLRLPRPKSMRELLREANFVPESVRADVLFRDMQKRKIHLCKLRLCQRRPQFLVVHIEIVRAMIKHPQKIDASVFFRAQYAVKIPNRIRNGAIYVSRLIAICQKTFFRVLQQKDMAGFSFKIPQGVFYRICQHRAFSQINRSELCSLFRNVGALRGLSASELRSLFGNVGVLRGRSAAAAQEQTQGAQEYRPTFQK